MTVGKCASAWSVGVLATLWAGSAFAGIPECGDLRLEGVSSCELRGSLDCTASCDRLGVYKKACATKLHKSCRQECVLDPEPRCEDECTTSCSRDCDLGVNVTCLHNCFGECVGACDVSCENAGDPATCRASCEATCDGECDTRCRPLVDGSCYTHCIECCGGSCKAQANMDCQTVCQEKEFEQCEYELAIDCQGQCTGDGAIFCDGEYVLGGTQIPACVSALATRGIAEIDIDGSGTIDIDDGKALGAGQASVSGCRLSPGGSSGAASAFLVVLAGLALGARKRRRSNGVSR
jgi:hypothetical protein